MTACNALDTAHSYLKSLGYDLETVPDDVQPLVQKLVQDALVARGTATEAQNQVERQGEDLQAALEKVSSLSRSVAEKEREVAYLLQDLAAQTKRASEGDSHLKSKISEAKSRIAVLESAAQQEAAKSARLEQERDGLRLKVQSLLEVSHQCKALGVPVENISTSIDVSAPLTTPSVSKDTFSNKTTALTGTTSTAATHQGGISLVKAAASRVSALESELSITRKKAEEYIDLSSSLKEASAAKDSEIARLKAQLAATRGALDLNTFEELSRHANKIGKELEELRQRSVDPKELVAAQHDKRAAEARAAAAESSRHAVAVEVDTLRRKLDKLEKDAEAGQCAENKVAKLRVSLDELKAQEAAAHAAAQLAEGRCAELQERLERRDAALQNAQARCRSLEADLRRLRHLQSLKAAAKTDKEEEEEEKSLLPILADDDTEEVVQLKFQCASMAAHLQKAMELQEAALEAASVATLERDEITDIAMKFKQELDAAKLQLQDAAAAAAAVRCRITSTAASSAPGSEVLDASYIGDEEEEEEDRSCNINTTSTTSTSSSSPSFSKRTNQSLKEETPHQFYIQNALSEALKEVEATRCDATEAQIEAQQEREIANTLRERCASMEAQIQALQNDNAMAVDTDAAVLESNSDFEMSLRAELEQKRQECEDLAAAGAQADKAMSECLEQLRAATTELQHTRNVAAAARAELQTREMQLESVQNAAQALERERAALHEQLVISQTALQQQNEGFTASFEAEREAAATEFDGLRSNMQALSRQYQELCAQAARMQRERDAASQLAEASATQAAFYEQETRAKESALGHAEASRAALLEENRRLQETIFSLQQEVAAQAYQAQFSSERTHAALQRRAATAEGSTALIEARLSDAVLEASTLRQQLAVQAARTEELEGLLLVERRKQFQEEEEENMNIDVLEADAEEEQHANEGQNGIFVQDAVDEAMMQRLSDLEIECVQLREALAQAQSEAGIKEERNSQKNRDLQEKLDNMIKNLLEEQVRREKLEYEASKLALERESQKSSPPTDDENMTPPEPLTAQTNVLQQLSTIAQGLKDLGKR